MAKNNSSNQDYTNNADGWDLTGGVTKRKLTVTGADITVTGSGSNTYTFPSASDTLVGRDSTDTLTNKTIDANGTGNSITNIDVADLADGTDGELITWDAAGAPTTVAAGTADQVLTSNGVGTAPTFQDAGGGSDILVETVAMPTSGWAVDGTYSDFYSATVSITGLFESTDVALATPTA